MDYHFDSGIKLQTDTKYKNLYSWAINEVDADGRAISGDLIPWEWSLPFFAKSCVVVDRFEIAKPFSFEKKSKEPPRIETDKVIRMILRPGWILDGELEHDATFSMLGTKRAIKNFMLEVHPIADAAEKEHCTAWGGISHTTEIDFRHKKFDDTLWFYLYLKPETFSHYVTLVSQGAINTANFNVGDVDGFYAEWSPGVSTDLVKVLVAGSEHKVDLPPDFEGEPPRLGRVGGARLVLGRQLEFYKDTAPHIENENDEPAPSAKPAFIAADVTTNQTPQFDPRILPALNSLKRGAWVIANILGLILIILMFK